MDSRIGNQCLDCGHKGFTINQGWASCPKCHGHDIHYWKDGELQGVAPIQRAYTTGDARGTTTK